MYNLKVFFWCCPFVLSPVAETEDAPRPQVTKFFSGDDLDDDFMVDETPAKKDKSSACVADTSGSKDGHVKAKRKQSTKVVNFVG